MKKRLLLLYFFILCDFAFTDENLYKVELITVLSKDCSFDYSNFFYDTTLLSIFSNIQSYVEKNSKNHYFSLSMDDIYINYSNNDDLLFSIGYWPKYQGEIIKKSNDILNQFMQDNSNKEDIDINIKLGQKLDIEEYITPKFKSKKMLIEQIDMDYTVVLYSYNNSYINVLLRKQ